MTIFLLSPFIIALVAELGAQGGVEQRHITSQMYGTEREIGASFEREDGAS